MGLVERGKTTLAGIIAKMSNSHFVNLNATNAGIGELRTIIEDARKRVRSLQQRTILFLDEIHRFNKKPTRCAVTLRRGWHNYSYWCHHRKSVF